MTQKSSWFKNKADESENVEEPVKPEQSGIGNSQRYTGLEPQVRTIALESEKSNVKSTRKKQPSTVLFVEFSKGGSLQKTVRGVLDRLEGMLGFTVRVTERGGTPLGALLSNKSLWKGVECGRGSAGLMPSLVTS